MRAVRAAEIIALSLNLTLRESKRRRRGSNRMQSLGQFEEANNIGVFINKQEGYRRAYLGITKREGKI
mgnify:CR=1 FL=1